MSDDKCSNSDVPLEEEKVKADEYVASEADDDEAKDMGGNFYELQGRHIVDINYLIEGLIRGCHSCKEPLRLSSCIGDTRYGPGSLLHIDCIKCHKVTLVPTGTRHGHNVWDINCKLGLCISVALGKQL